MKKALVLLAVFFAIIAVSGALADTTFVCGDVSGVWDSSGSRFCVVCDVRVPPGSTLVIEPGVDVVFMAEFKFTVDTNAVLRAIGTVTDSILFTAFDTVRTDTSGGWKGLIFIDSTSAGSVAYCRFEYANDYAIVIGYSAPYISNCLIRSCMNGVYGRRNELEELPLTFHTVIGGSKIIDIDGTGVVASGGQGRMLGISNTTISNCNIGIAGHFVSVVRCNIENNTGAGFGCGHSYYVFRNCTIRNNGGDAIRGEGWSGDIYNCIIENNGGYAIYQTGCMCSEGMEIFENTVRNNGGGIYISDMVERVEVRDNIIYNNIGDGLTVSTYCVYERDSLIITGNKIHNNSGRGLVAEIYPASWYSTFIGYIKIVNNLVFDNNSDTCVAITYWDTSRVEIEFANNTVENLIIHRNPEGWPWGMPNVTAYLFNNAFIENGYDYIHSPSVTTYSTNNIDYYASGFVDSYSGNYHLTDSSPCIDYGIGIFTVGEDTFYAPSVDIEQNPRPCGSGFDIGAFEYVPTYMDSTLHYWSGWNMVSVPIAETLNIVTTFPSLIGLAYLYDTESKCYQPTYELIPGRGYWLPLSEADFIPISGDPLDSVKVELHIGWNLIGTCSEPAHMPFWPYVPHLGYVYGYEYSNGEYYSTSTMLPGRAYWAFSEVDSFVVIKP